MALWVERLEPFVAEALFFGSPERELKLHSSMLMGIYYGAPRHAMLGRCVQRVSEMLDERLDDNSKVKAATFLLAYCNLSGDLQRGRLVVQRVGSLLSSPDIIPLDALWWFLRLGHYYTMVGESTAAAAALARSRDIGEMHGLAALHSAGLLLRSYETNLACLQGDVERAQRLDAEIEALAAPTRPMDVLHLLHNPAYVATLRGDAEAMYRSGQAAYQAAIRTNLRYTMVICSLYEAHGLAMLLRNDEMRETLTRARELIAGTCMQYFECEARYVEAYAALKSFGPETARPSIEGAVRYARDRQYHYPYMSRIGSILPVVLGAALEAGIEPGYVRDVVRRYRLLPRDRDLQHWPWPIRIHCLGRFEVQLDGVPLRFNGKTPRKPLALLKALIAFGGSDVPQAKLVDALWPDDEGDAGKQAFGVTMVRLRKLLGAHDAIVVADERVSLNRALCWVDTRAFEARLKQADEERAKCGLDQAVLMLEDAVALYGGAFLPSDGEEPWTVQLRLRLRGLFTVAVEDLAGRYEASADWPRAIECYRRGLEADDLVEEFYLGMMRCYRALGRPAEGIGVYRRLRQTLSVVLGVAPSAASEAAARALRDGGQATAG
jgi:DNA-binding SARP family transcriptional activator